MLAFGSHLALAPQVPVRWMIVLPGLTGLFCVGRMLFWVSYRSGAAARSCGFALTFYPSLGAWLKPFVPCCEDNRRAYASAIETSLATVFMLRAVPNFAAGMRKVERAMLLL